MKLNESKLIIFANPAFGTVLMQQDMTVGLDLPLHILVYKDFDGKVKIAYRNGSWLESIHDFNSPKIVKEMNNAMNEIILKAIKSKESK